MDAQSEPQQPNFTRQPPSDAYYQVIHTLRAALRPVSDTPEDLARRDNAAIAQVACLLPANADEADLAAQYVAANAQAMECLRLARKYPGDPNFVLKCTGHAASMMRQARATRSLLQRVQSARQELAADSAAADRAASTEHCALGLMADALDRAPPAATAEPPPPSATVEEAPPQADPVAEADLYALTYPRRAALIRSQGGVPHKCGFAPPSAELVRAIVTGTSPTLRALDSPAESLAAAAD